ncbi:MAG: TlpA family protein disulfide reductase [Planctomycetota bacterium]
MKGAAVGSFVFWALAGIAFAQSGAESLTTIPLSDVRWAGPPVSLEKLKGKSVAVLVYASWCPKCNAWSGELFKQLKEAVATEPAVILAIYSDNTPAAARSYLAERGFFGPNIVHGFDPAMHTKLGLESNLFKYVLIEPSGAIGERGDAGSYFTGGSDKRFVLAKALAEPKNRGTFRFISEDMSEPVRNMLWPLELGMGSEAALNKSRAALTNEQKEELDSAVGRFMDAGLAEIRGLYKGTLEERFAAHEKANQLGSVFKSTAQSQKAREVVAFLEKDESFKCELAAKKAYDACMERAGTPGRRGTLLRGVAERFEGTHYGKLAEESLESE